MSVLWNSRWLSWRKWSAFRQQVRGCYKPTACLRPLSSVSGWQQSDPGCCLRQIAVDCSPSVLRCRSWGLRKTHTFHSSHRFHIHHLFLWKWVKQIIFERPSPLLQLIQINWWLGCSARRRWYHFLHSKDEYSCKRFQWNRFHNKSKKAGFQSNLKYVEQSSPSLPPGRSVRDMFPNKFTLSGSEAINRFVITDKTNIKDHFYQKIRFFVFRIFYVLILKII